MEDLENLLEISEKKIIPKRFPMLNTLSWIYRKIGQILIFIGLIAMLAFFGAELEGKSFSSFFALSIFIPGIIIGLIFLVISEIILVFLQIEINTRKTQN